MQTKHLIPLAILLEEQELATRTRLQKLSFFTQSELDIESKLDYVWYEHGPYSRELISVIDELCDTGLLTRMKHTNAYGRVRYEFTITQQWNSAFQYNAENSADADEIRTVLKTARSVTDQYGSVSLDELIQVCERKQKARCF